MTESVVRLRWPDPEAFSSMGALRRAMAERTTALEEILERTGRERAPGPLDEVEEAEEAGAGGVESYSIDFTLDLPRSGGPGADAEPGDRSRSELPRKRPSKRPARRRKPAARRPTVRTIETAPAALRVESDAQTLAAIEAERSDLVREVTHDIGFAVPPPEIHLLGGGGRDGAASDPLRRLGLDPNAPAAERRAAGAGVRVSIIDSGLQADHPELRNARILTRESYDYWHLAAPREGVVDYIALPAGETPKPRHYHGTAVAGLVAGATTGVAPGVELVVHNVFYRASPREAEGLSWRDGDGVLRRPDTTLLRIEPAIMYSLGAQADILVLSLGTPGPNPCFENEVRYVARTFGRLMVVASGNSGPGSRLSPGDYADVLSVGALDPDDRPWPRTSAITVDQADGSYAKPDLYAPGVDLKAPVPTTVDPTGYRRVTGTSFAAPLVAGVAALVLGLCRERGRALPAAAIRDHLLETADDLALPPELGGTGKRLNTARALERLP